MRNLKKFLALVLAVMMVMGLMVTANAAEMPKVSLGEIDGTYASAAKVLATLGVIKGDAGTGDFHPEREVTRAEFAMMIYRIYTGDVDGDDVGDYAGYVDFSDVTTNKWYSGAVGFVQAAGIMQGDAGRGGTFRPGEPITVFEVLRTLLGALGYGKAGEFGEYTWKLDSADLADTLHLKDEIDAQKVNLRGNATREVVAQLIFNTMFQDRKGWDGTAYTSLGTMAVKRLHIEEETSTDEFGRPATVYTKNGVTLTTVAAPNATKVWSFTAAITDEGEELTAALGEAFESFAAVYTDGVKTEEGELSGVDVAAVVDASGNGVLIEVYKQVIDGADGEEPTTEYTLVIVNTYAVVLEESMITPADEDEETERTITLTDPDDGEITVVTDEYEVGDVILYTVTANDDEDSEEAYKVVDINVIEPALTGYVSHAGTDDAGDDYIRINRASTKYYLAENSVEDYDLPDPAVTEYDFYLDDYGYLVYAAEVEEDDGDDEGPASYYVYVEAFESTDTENLNQGTDNKMIGNTAATVVEAAAKVVDLETGETSVIKIGVKKDTNDDNKWKYLGADGKIPNESAVEVEGTEKDSDKFKDFMLCTDLGDGTYALTNDEDNELADVDAAKVATKKGDGNVTYKDGDGGTVPAISSTKLIVLTVSGEGTEDDPYTYEVDPITGYKNFVKMDANENAIAALIVTDEDGSAIAIYLAVPADDSGETSKSDYAIYIGQGEEVLVGEGKNAKTVYEQFFYVNGKKETYYSEESGAEFVDDTESDGESVAIGSVYVLTVDEDGVIESATHMDETNDAVDKIESVSVVNSDYIEGEAATVYFASSYYVYTQVTNTESDEVVSVKSAKINTAKERNVLVFRDKKDGVAVLVLILADLDE